MPTHFVGVAEVIGDELKPDFFREPRTIVAAW
jgi:hypothetical protein